MRQAAELYLEDSETSLNIMTATVECFRRDLAALVARDPIDEVTLGRELAVAEEMHARLLDGAPQGTLHGP